MVLGIDEWLLRGADLRLCDPDDEKCKDCSNIECEYWQDYNEVRDD